MSRTADDTDVGSLRWAISCCRTDTIAVPPGTYLLSMCAPMAPVNLGTCTIVGSGAQSTILDGNRCSPLLYVVGQWHGLTVKNLTMQNGYSTYPTTDLGPGSGGALGYESNLALTIDSVQFFDNVATGWAGGAIYTSNNLPDFSASITNSTFARNTSVGRGGAIAFYNQLNPTPAVVLANNTFVDNATTDAGNGAAGAVLINQGDAVVVNNTFAGNDAPYMCSQIYLGHSGAALLANNVLSAAGHNGNCGAGGSSCQLTDGGHNISDDASCDSIFTATGSLNSTNPRLDPAGLASNGGQTQTIALCTGVDSPSGCAGASAAINAGANATCSASPVSGLDQRGYYRPGFGETNCAIGAFEPYSDVSTPTPTSAASVTPTPTATPTPTKTPTPTVTPTPTFAGRFIRSQGLRLTRPAAPMRMEHGNAPLSLHPVE